MHAFPCKLCAECSWGRSCDTRGDDSAQPDKLYRDRVGVARVYPGRVAGDWVDHYFLAGMVSLNRAGKEGMGRVTALFLFCSAHDFMAPDMVCVIIFMSTGDGRKRRAAYKVRCRDWTRGSQGNGMKAAGDCKSHAEMTWPVTVTECKIRDSGFKEVFNQIDDSSLAGCILRVASCRKLQRVGTHSDRPWRKRQ